MITIIIVMPIKPKITLDHREHLSGVIITRLRYCPLTYRFLYFGFVVDGFCGIKKKKTETESLQTVFIVAVLGS